MSVEADDIKDFDLLAKETQHVEKDFNTYAFVRRAERFYGKEAVYRSMEFFTQLLLSGERVENLQRAFISVAKRNKNEKFNISISSVRWAQDLDLVGLDNAMMSIKTKTGYIWEKVKDFDEKEIQEELAMLAMVRLEWQTLINIKKEKSEFNKRMLWTSFRKKIHGKPYDLLKAKHAARNHS